MARRKAQPEQVKIFAREFVRHLSRAYGLPVRAAYVFGSYAKGNWRRESDIDIAVISEKFRGALDPYVFLGLWKRPIDRERGIAAVGFHPEDFVLEDPLVAEIQAHGIKI